MPVESWSRPERSAHSGTIPSRALAPALFLLIWCCREAVSTLQRSVESCSELFRAIPSHSELFRAHTPQPASPYSLSAAFLLLISPALPPATRCSCSPAPSSSPFLSEVPITDNLGGEITIRSCQPEK